MAIVSVSVFPGLSEVQEEFLARGIVDVVAAHAGTPREAVQVLISDHPRESWAIGPRLASSVTTAPARDSAAFVNLRRQYIRPDKHEDYLIWRRDSVYPFMASHEGFISSMVMVSPDQPDQYLIANKWASIEAQEAYRANPREAKLKEDALALQSQRPTDDFNGYVVDVFHHDRR